MGALAGKASDAGVVSNVRQLSRSVVSASLQVGKQIEGGGVWRALAGSGASEGGATVGVEVVGKLALQPLASSASAISISGRALDARIAHGCDFVDAFTVFLFK